VLGRSDGDRDGVEVRLQRPDASVDVARLFDDAERAQLARLRRPTDRLAFVTGHSLLRRMLAEQAGVPPDEVRLGYRCLACGGAHGKPAVVTPTGYHVSLAHTAGCVAVAVTTLGPIGIDVEPAGAVTFDGFPDVALAEHERTAVGRLNAEERPRALTMLWVRKEAVLKATGHGMLMAPSNVVVSCPPTPPKLLAWDGADPPRGPIHLVDLPVSGWYAASVAVLAAEVPRVMLSAGPGAWQRRERGLIEPRRQQRGKRRSAELGGVGAERVGGHRAVPVRGCPAPQ